MKTRLTIAALATILMLGACSKGTEYTINGHAEDFIDGKKVYLVRTADNELQILDSTIVKDHSFTLQGEVETPYLAMLGILDSFNSNKGIIVELFIEAGDIKLGDLDEEINDRVATGTPLNDKLAQFYREEKAIKAILNKKALSKIEIYEQHFAFIHSHVKENSDNELGLFLFERYEPSMPKEMKLELIDQMKPEYKALYANLYNETLEELEEQKREEEMAKTVQPGNPYKNIREKGMDGKTITLKEVVESPKNKYVLLDFWATWCGPCMNEIPYLINAYNRYHDKGVEIYAVSIDDDADAWVKTIKAKGLQWINVRREDKETTDQYGISGIPSNYLIESSTGKIVATNLRGNALEKKLGELLD